MTAKLIGIWFLAPPLVLSAARVKENCFSLSFNYGPMLAELAEGVNREFLPSFWWCWTNAEAWAGGRGPAARKCARSGAILG
jgi:hypothetical protein